jgi:elongation factor G
MVEMQANDRIELQSAEAGDIIAIVGMKNVRTGQTLCSPNHECTLEAMVFPEPVISIAVAPKDKGSTEKMSIAIGKMVAEDPTFRVETDEDSGETILRGMGELHLDIKVDILKRTYDVELIVGQPQVAYRETITKPVQDSYTHKKQSGGAGQYGKIDYTISPGEPNSGFTFTSSVVGGNVPKEFFPAIEKGFRSMMGTGTLAGFPVLDVVVDLKDGAYHPVDSSAIAFEIAAKGAFRQSIPKASPQLLEPIMKVDVYSTEEDVGNVIGDLNRRRGMISGQEPSAAGVRIKADVPLSEMFGYISTLRTLTSGRGQFSMEFSHYAPCPNSVAEAVIAKEKEKKAAAK